MSSELLFHSGDKSSHRCASNLTALNDSKIAAVNQVVIMQIIRLLSKIKAFVEQQAIKSKYIVNCTITIYHGHCKDDALHQRVGPLWSLSIDHIAPLSSQVKIKDWVWPDQNNANHVGRIESSQSLQRRSGGKLAPPPPLLLASHQRLKTGLLIIYKSYPWQWIKPKGHSMTSLTKEETYLIKSRRDLNNYVNWYKENTVENEKFIENLDHKDKKILTAYLHKLFFSSVSLSNIIPSFFIAGGIIIW